MDTLLNMAVAILAESIALFNTMAPFLLLGFLCGGILHIFVSSDQIARHLGRKSAGSVVKAALFGIPLPLCSCGVLSVALSLRKSGASRGAIVSFLISTPTTGVDSVFATYSLLGPLFAVYRIISSFVAGLFSGLLVNVFAREGKQELPAKNGEGECKVCDEKDAHLHTVSEKIKALVHYAVTELVVSVGKWLLLGTLIGGILSYLIPDDFFSTSIAQGWQAIVVMIIAGIPLYVCATGSIPIAAALMLKGMNPGAAFAFLLAGPATNAMAIAVITGFMGKKVVVLYLGAICLSSIVLGLLLDRIWILWDSGIPLSSVGYRTTASLPQWVEIASAILLLGLIVYPYIRKLVRIKNKRTQIDADGNG